MINWERVLAGALVGVFITYVCGALIAWDSDPGHWSVLWRAICICFAILWAIVGVAVATLEP